MNHAEVLKRAWHTVWTYRTLWIFGVILALVTFSWGTWALFDREDGDWEQRGITITVLDGETFWEAFQRTMQTEVDRANRELNALLAEELGLDVMVNVLTIAAVLTALAVIAYVVGKIARYVSETALIRMVEEYQETGERLSVRQGVRLGWSRSAWRLFLIDLLINILAVLAGVLLFALIFAPLPLWVDGAEGVIFVFAFLTAGLFFLAIAVVIVATAAVSVWKRLARQACALEGMGVTEAVRRALAIVCQHLRDAGLTWLVTLSVRLGWTALIVPLLILLSGAGLIIGGLPGLAAAGLAAGRSGDTAVVVGLAVGIPIFLLVLVAPLALLGGLREVFISSLWTLTYHKLQGLECVVSKPLPAVGTPGLEAAPITS